MKDRGFPPNTLYGWIDKLQKIKAKYGRDMDVNFEFIPKDATFANTPDKVTISAVHHHTFDSRENGVTIIIDEL